MKLKRRTIIRYKVGDIERYSGYTHWKIQKVSFAWNAEGLFLSMNTKKFEWEIEFTIDECQSLMRGAFRSIQEYISKNFKKLKKLK